MRTSVNTLFLFMLLGLISGCAVIGGIFQAGVGVGIFITVALAVLVIYLMTKISRRP
jgi:hypothetical protein